MENKSIKNYSLAGGHHDRFEIDKESPNDSVIIKKTNNFELGSYEVIFKDDEADKRHEENVKFRTFIP